MKELEDEVRRLQMENEFLKKQGPSLRGLTRSRAVHSHRRGESQLQDLLDVRPIVWATLVLVTTGFEAGWDSFRCRPVAARLNRTTTAP